MRTLFQPLVMAACLLGPGCQFVCQVGRNLIHEPLMACDEKQIRHRCIKLGKQAWNEMVRQYGDNFSCDYRRGFVDGFSDYLIYGGCIGDGGCCAGQCGNGSTAGGSSPAQAADAGSFKEYPVCPPVPPERYRRKRFMTPEGCAAIEDWYAGFKHGAATAMASGLRTLVVIPVQCPPKFGPEDGFQPQVSIRPTASKVLPKDTTPPMPPPEEITQPGTDALPQPRPTPETPPA